MTLGRFSILLTVFLVVVPIVATFSAGMPRYTGWFWFAFLPSYLAYRSDYTDWTLGHLIDHLRGEDPVEVALDDALRPPIPTPGLPEDDGAFFVPDCPPLR